MVEFSIAEVAKAQSAVEIVPSVVHSAVGDDVTSGEHATVCAISVRAFSSPSLSSSKDNGCLNCGAEGVGMFLRLFLAECEVDFGE